LNVFSSLEVLLPVVIKKRYFCFVVVDNCTFFSLQAVALFRSYFGGAFDEDAIRNNFVLIYELLDGM